MPRFIDSISVKDVSGTPVGIVRFSERMEVLSSAVLNGGSSEAEAAFVMEVPKDFRCGEYARVASDVRDALGLPADSVGMMTAAEVDRVFNAKSCAYGGAEVTAFATAGLANHVVAGEPLDDYDAKSEASMRRMRALRPGTINIGVVSPEPLTMEAKVNLMMPIVEAKALAMRDLGFLETGTTSDSVAVFCPKEGARLRWAGTGTDVGIAAARAVREAVSWSLRARGEHPLPPGDGAQCLMDMAAILAPRADSLAEDGFPDYLEIAKGMFASALGCGEAPDGRLADAVLRMASEKKRGTGPRPGWRSARRMPEALGDRNPPGHRARRMDRQHLGRAGMGMVQNMMDHETVWGC